MHYYSLYDLPICSELHLASVATGQSLAKDPLIIRFGKVDAEGLINPLRSGFGFQYKEKEFWLNIPPIGRFLIRNGQEIIIDCQSGINENDLLPFVLGTAMEMLLRQRNFFVIPGFAIQSGDSAIIFAASPSQGYAMLQGGLFKKNHAFYGSNTVVMNPTGEILPGIAQLEFWPEIAAALKLEPEKLVVLRSSISKKVLSLSEDKFAKTKYPLKMIYLLKQNKDNNLEFIPIKKADKRTVLEQTIKHCPGGLFFQYPTMFDNISMVRIHVPAKGFYLQNLVKNIENHMQQGTHSHVII